MLKYLFSFLFVILCCSSSKVLAQQYTGCLYGGYIYYTPQGTSGGVPNYRKAPPGSRVLTGAAFCVVNIGGSCRIDKKASQTGSLRTFYLVQCPIDDYVPLIILLVGGFAFYTIRGLNPKTA